MYIKVIQLLVLMERRSLSISGTIYTSVSRFCKFRKFATKALCFNNLCQSLVLPRISSHHVGTCVLFLNIAAVCILAIKCYRHLF